MTEPAAAVAAALAGRKELALQAEPSVAAVGALLAARCRNPAPWIRAAFGTIGRFAEEVAGGDLAALLARGRAGAGVAEHSLKRLAIRHDGCAAGQLAALSFGPKLWWRVGGVELPWRELVGPAGARPIPAVAGRVAGDVRLVLLALVGTGLTAEELLGVRVTDAGSLDAAGRLVPDLAAEPLAIEYQPAEGGERRLSFLPFEARAAVRERLAGRVPGPDEPLLLPADQAAAARTAAMARAAALISAGNEVNVTLCRATGDFFRAWGMPGARFEARQSKRERR